MSKIFDFFKKIWDKIRKYLAIILVIIAVIFFCWAALIYLGVMAGATFTVLGVTLSITSAAAAFAIGALALVGAFLLDEEAASDTVDEIKDAVTDASEAVGDVVGGAVGGVIGGATSGLWSTTAGKVLLLGGGALLLWWLLGSGDDTNGDAAQPTSGATLYG